MVTSQTRAATQATVRTRPNPTMTSGQARPNLLSSCQTVILVFLVFTLVTDVSALNPVTFNVSRRNYLFFWGAATVAFGASPSIRPFLAMQTLK